MKGGLAMLLGRYVPLLVALAVAGALASRPVMASGRGTLRTDNATFVVLVLAVVVTVALLTFVPALALGPGVQGLSERLFYRSSQDLDVSEPHLHAALTAALLASRA